MKRLQTFLVIKIENLLQIRFFFERCSNTLLVFHNKSLLSGQSSFLLYAINVFVIWKYIIMKGILSLPAKNIIMKLYSYSDAIEDLKWIYEWILYSLRSLVTSTPRLFHSLSLRGWPIELHQTQWEINETEHVPFFRFGTCSLLLYWYLPREIALLMFGSPYMLSILERFFHSTFLAHYMEQMLRLLFHSNIQQKCIYAMYNCV